MEIVSFQKNEDPNDKCFGYLFVRLSKIVILRLPVVKSKTAFLYVNIPSQFVKSTGKGRPWIAFESKKDWYELKKMAEDYLAHID